MILTNNKILKTCLCETLNILMFTDGSTNTKTYEKEKKKKWKEQNITCPVSHVT